MSEIFTQINLHENEAELLIVEEKAFRNATRNAFDALAYGNHSIKPYYKSCPIMQKLLFLQPKNKLATTNFSHYYVWMKGNFINRVSSYCCKLNNSPIHTSRFWLNDNFVALTSSLVNPWTLLLHNILTLFKSWFISKSTKFTFDIFLYTNFFAKCQVSSPHIFHQLK